MDSSGWIKTSEQMPDVHAEALGYDAFYAVIDRAVWSDAEDEPRLVFLRTDDCEITHWMPMPPPPEVET